MRTGGPPSQAALCRAESRRYRRHVGRVNLQTLAAGRGPPRLRPEPHDPPPRPALGLPPTSGRAASVAVRADRRYPPGLTMPGATQRAPRASERGKIPDRRVAVVRTFPTRSPGAPMRRIFAAALLLAPALPAPVHAQGPDLGPDATVDAATRARVIDGVLGRLNEDYVFPAKAADMAKAVREHARRGAYERVDQCPGLRRHAYPRSRGGEPRPAPAGGVPERRRGRRIAGGRAVARGAAASTRPSRGG